MSSYLIFTDFYKDVEKYLKAKLPEATDDVIADTSAYVAYKAIILVNDLERERVRREHLDRTAPLRKKISEMKKKESDT